MDDAGFIVGSYLITFGVVALYAWLTVRRGRKLSARVPEEEKYWT